MALSEPAVERELLHNRDIALRGFRRVDGLFDVEARLTDNKTYGFPNEHRGWIAPGDHLHGMWARMTVDRDLTIVSAEASTEQGPFDICPAGAESFARLAGLAIKPGFLRAAGERIGGIKGCTHLRELLQQMATVAFQTAYAARRSDMPAADRAAAVGKPTGRESSGDGASPRLLNTCHAYASDNSVVQKRWPHLYTGPDTGLDHHDAAATPDVAAEAAK